MLDVEVVRTLSLASGHLSAASGLVCVGSQMYVVADDEHLLGVFGPEGAGRLQRLFDGDLPVQAKARKAAKPDLEALVQLPPWRDCPHGALLALGSGSSPQRQRGALLALNAAGGLQGPVQELDLSSLYEPLRARHAQLNIEGGFVGTGRLHLLQRGNAADPANVQMAFDWPALQSWLGGGPVPAPVTSKRHELGCLDGVALCFTDGAALAGGGWVFCAAAEATDDNYADGPCRGSAVGVVGADGQLLGLRPLSLRCKAEGIAARVEAGVLHLLMVTDPDDRDAPALLLSASLALAT